MLKDRIAIRVHTLQARDALFGAWKQRWAPASPHCLTHPFTRGLTQTTESSEGKPAGGRRKERGNRRGKQRGKGGDGTWPLDINPGF